MSRSWSCDRPPQSGGPADGQWSSWYAWESCSVTCGAGIVKRHRYCINPAPSGGGRDCPGDNAQTRTCFPSACAVAGQWGLWTEMSPCSDTCGDGKLSRYRNCDNPAPSSGGAMCTGSDTETYNCHMLGCKVDGVWGPWQGWSTCSVSSDIGQISRGRSCDNPAPSGGGSPCAGNATETNDCSAGSCIVWSQWYDGACSVTCGNGTIERLRHCSTGRDVDCHGPAYAHVPCMKVSCLSEGT